MNEHNTQNHRLRNQSCCTRPRGGCPNDVATLSGPDVSSQTKTRQCDMDHPLSVDPHHVDAFYDRRLFHRCRGKNSRLENSTTLACGLRAQSHEAGAGSSNGDGTLGGRFTHSFRSKRLSPRRSRNRRGQAMLEFALMIPLIILIVGATISFGLFFFQGNVLQMAVDVGAQEISRMPFQPTQDLGLGQLDKCGDADLVCNAPEFKAQIFDESHLVIADSQWQSMGSFQDYVDTLPLLNRLLVPVMIRQCIDLGGPSNTNQTHGTGSPASNGGFWVTRYPGTLVQNCDDELTVLIPIVDYNPDGSGEVILEWVAPVEEMRIDHDDDPGTARVGPFSLDKPSGFTSSDTEASFLTGMVALRINYPAQSTTLLNRIDLEDPVQNPDGKRGQIIVRAGGTSIGPDATLDGYTLANVAGRISPASGRPGSDPNAGRYGLGELEALQQIIRPYRKVMTFQAIYRREVFNATGTP